MIKRIILMGVIFYSFHNINMGLSRQLTLYSVLININIHSFLTNSLLIVSYFKTKPFPITDFTETWVITNVTDICLLYKEVNYNRYIQSRTAYVVSGRGCGVLILVYFDLPPLQYLLLNLHIVIAFLVHLLFIIIYFELLSFIVLICLISL